MTEDDEQNEEEMVFLQFKNLKREELSKLFNLLDDEFEALKEIIKKKIG